MLCVFLCVYVSQVIFPGESVSKCVSSMINQTRPQSGLHTESSFKEPVLNIRVSVNLFLVTTRPRCTGMYEVMMHKNKLKADFHCFHVDTQRLVTKHRRPNPEQKLFLKKSFQHGRQLCPTVSVK